MAITITDTSMRSDKTGNTATYLRSDEGWQRREVTWLPGRVLGRSEAITAMMLAQTVAVVRASDSPAVREWLENEPEAG